MIYLFQNGSSRYRLPLVTGLCFLLVLCWSPAGATAGKRHHKSLSRLKTGLASVRDSSAKAKSRLKDLKERENFLESRTEDQIVPKALPSIHDDLLEVRSEIRKIKSTKPSAVRKKLLSLFDLGNANALALIAGTHHDRAFRNAREVRSVLSSFESKEDVLHAIDKIERANEQPSPKSAVFAKAELKKIRFERSALLKKIHKCDLDEKTILAEMEVVKDIEMEKDYAGNDPASMTSERLIGAIGRAEN